MNHVAVALGNPQNHHLTAEHVEWQVEHCLYHPPRKPPLGSGGGSQFDDACVLLPIVVKRPCYQFGSIKNAHGTIFSDLSHIAPNEARDEIPDNPVFNGC